MGFKNKFSWSPQREEMFNTCELCYVLHYYTAHEGWLSSASVDAQAAYRWKKARTMDQLVHRTLVDTLIKRVYTGSPSLKELYASIMSQLDEAFRSSLKSKRQWYHKPNQSPMLYELAYEDEVDASYTNQVKKDLQTAIAHFKGSQLVKELADKTNTLLEVRQQFRGGYSYFDHDKLGVRMYADVQVVHERADGTIIATVFKTTKEPTSLSHIRLIAQVISETKEVDIERIIVRDEYLCDGTWTDFPVSRDTIRLSDIAMEDSVNMMADFLIGGDLKKNEFLGFEQADYNRSREHQRAEDNKCSMIDCPYCEAVRRDLELYPEGYDHSKSVLRYKEKKTA